MKVMTEGPISTLNKAAYNAYTKWNKLKKYEWDNDYSTKASKGDIPANLISDKDMEYIEIKGKDPSSGYIQLTFNGKKVSPELVDKLNPDGGELYPFITSYDNYIVTLEIPMNGDLKSALNKKKDKKGKNRKDVNDNNDGDRTMDNKEESLVLKTEKFEALEWDDECPIDATPDNLDNADEEYNDDLLALEEAVNEDDYKTIKVLPTRRNTWYNVLLIPTQEEARSLGFNLMYEDKEGSIFGIRDKDRLHSWEQIAFVPYDRYYDNYFNESVMVPTPTPFNKGNAKSFREIKKEKAENDSLELKVEDEDEILTEDLELNIDKVDTTVVNNEEDNKDTEYNYRIVYSSDESNGQLEEIIITAKSPEEAVKKFNKEHGTQNKVLQVSNDSFTDPKYYYKPGWDSIMESVSILGNDYSELDEVLDLSEPKVNYNNGQDTRGMSLDIDINGKSYKYIPRYGSTLAPKEVAAKVKRLSKRSPGRALAYLKHRMDLMPITEGYHRESIDTKEKIKNEVIDKFYEYMKGPKGGFESDEDIKDYLNPHIDIEITDDGYTRIEFRYEAADYDSMINVANELTKVVEKYDKNAYFDLEDYGILSAYLDIDESINESLTEETNRKFVELEDFSKDWEQLGLTDEDLKDLQNLILKGNETWTPLGGEAYKIRFSPKSYNKGKNSALRSIFIDAVIEETIYLVKAFSKADQSDINVKERQHIINLSKEIKEES